MPAFRFLLKRMQHINAFRVLQGVHGAERITAKILNNFEHPAPPKPVSTWVCGQIENLGSLTAGKQRLTLHVLGLLDPEHLQDRRRD